MEQFVTSETVEVFEAAFNVSEYDKDSYDFRRFVVDAELPLFEGSECTKLDSMLKLHNWKARIGIAIPPSLSCCLQLALFFRKIMCCLLIHMKRRKLNPI